MKSRQCQRYNILLTLWCVMCVVPGFVWADPCGMVPPMYIGTGEPITRVGPQKTYVFFQEGVESVVLRPGFSGKVEQFGMLIPFPSPPAIRKMPDNIFPHIAAAIDPPVVNVYVGNPIRTSSPMKSTVSRPESVRVTSAPPRNTVRVLKKEAVGMYQVAVLRAGSAKALKRWMDSHGYRYPKGMDKVCEEYVKIGWTFVAVKARVAGKKGVQPRPGMRRAHAGFPSGARFRGKVQAMGFRFRTKKLVVPMRLSAFNKGYLRNIVYVLTSGPRHIRHIPKTFVRRQVSGRTLHRNITKLLPMRVFGGTPQQIKAYQWPGIRQRRDPKPHNRFAKELFASDLLAVQTKKLSLAHEEYKKVLLRIGERLMLRGKIIDQLNRDAISAERGDTVARALEGLKGMTMTVIDGHFPRDVLARENLTFARYEMPKPKKRSFYRYNAPAMRRMYIARSRIISYWEGPKPKKAVPRARPQPRARQKASPANGLPLKNKWMRWIAETADAKQANRAVASLVREGAKSLKYLLGEVLEGPLLTRRGWSFVALAEIGKRKPVKTLAKIYNDARQPALVRTWALATMIALSRNAKEINALSAAVKRFPAAVRPLLKKIEALSAQGGSLELETLLLFSFRSGPKRRAEIQNVLLRQKPEALVRLMLKSKSNSNRRIAASYLGAQAQQQRTKVVRALIGGYRFRKAAKHVPWKGGALFMPSVKYFRYEVQKVVSSLITWMVWCENNGQRSNYKMIHNNLRGLRLSRAAGYSSPGWRMIRADGWLRIWGRVVGRQEIKRLLREAGALEERRYNRVLKSLP